MDEKKLYVCESNGNLRKNIELLKENGYTYIIKCVDKRLSGWGGATGKKHIQLIACKDASELTAVLSDVENDKSFNYVDWNYIQNYKSIYNWTKNKSYTIRNDWTRYIKQ